MLYAVYIVMIKRRVDREDKLDIPMFFGKHMSLFVFKDKASLQKKNVYWFLQLFN